MAWMGKAIWESSLLNSMKQYETKDKWHIIYVYKCNPFMSTERKWGEFKNFLRIHDRKPYDTPKTFQNLRLLPGLSIFWQVHMPCLALATVEKKQFPTEVLFKQLMKFFSGCLFLLPKMPNNKDFQHEGSPLPNAWTKCYRKKSWQKRNNFGVSTVASLKTEFKIPKIGFPRSVPPTSSFLGKGFNIKWCLNVKEVSVDTF